MRLQEVLKIRGISQMQLARLSNMHATTISLIASGRLLASESQKVRIAKALDVPIETIWPGEGA